MSYTCKSLKYVFRFLYSDEYYESHLPLLNNLTPSEETKLNKFLHFIDETQLKFKRPPEEVNHIKEAVHEVVDSFAKHLESTDPLLAVSRKYAVGSMAEGTKIKEPDEFDFILVFKELTADNVSVETITTENIHIECEGDFECCSKINSNHVPMRKIQKCTGDIEYQHVHLPLTNLANSGNFKNLPLTNQANSGIFKKFPGIWKRLGYVCNWKNHFFQCLDRDSNGMLGFLNLEVNKNTGTIKNKKQDISKLLINAGPAMKLELLWESQSGNQLEIAVDIVLAIEMNGIENVINMENVTCQKYRKILVETDQFFLIPIQVAAPDVCFKVTFTTTEQKAMTDLSKEHILCYRILKYLFHGRDNLTSEKLLSSYFLKTFLLRHTAMCISQYNPARCLTDILKVLSIAFKECMPGSDNYIEHITVEHLLIPGQALGNGENCIHNEISKFLTLNTEQLLEAAKSEHNDQVKDLERLKESWKIVNDEISETLQCQMNVITYHFIWYIMTGPGEPADKLLQIARLVVPINVTSINDIAQSPEEAAEKLNMIAKELFPSSFKSMN